MICKKIKETTKMILDQEYNNKRQYERCFEKLDKLFADSRDNKFYVRVPPVQSGEEPDIYNKYGELISSAELPFFVFWLPKLLVGRTFLWRNRDETSGRKSQN